MDSRIGLKCYGIKKGKTGVGIALMEGRIFAVYTQNRIKAAPVLFNMKNLGRRVKGIIVNSGNANAFTGEEGLRNTRRMVEFMAEKLNCNLNEIAVASTGIIGRQLDIKEIEEIAEEVFENLGGDSRCIEAFAKAIMTTDRFPKIARREFDGIEILGIAKGAGMISPNMATMLAFIFTNADVESMEVIFRKAVDMSFNRLIVDGDTSTNDTIFMITSENVKAEGEKFRKELTSLMIELAEMIAEDGEGSTKVFRVYVSGAKSQRDAELIARAVARSNLVKTAIYGKDPNFGRIVCAIGYSGADVDENLTIKIKSRKGEVKIIDRGRVIEDSMEDGRDLMSEKFIEIHIQLEKGNGSFYIIGCDLTHDYVELNSRYTT